MKVVILAGGRGTRMSEATAVIPKPMVEIGDRPILWHIMRIYAHHGFRDFIICLGYKGHVIKEYFASYLLHRSDVTIDLESDRVEYHRRPGEDWRVTLVATGDATQTGGRIRRVASYLTPGEPFCMTYGDGVGDVDIGRSVAFHREHGKLATVTAVHPPPRFGGLRITGDIVTEFTNAPIAGRVNGGFFVLSPGVVDLIDGDTTTFEDEPLQTLARDGQLAAFIHDGFWQPMDTQREKLLLSAMWESGHAPWKVWT